MGADGKHSVVGTRKVPKCIQGFITFGCLAVTDTSSIVLLLIYTLHRRDPIVKMPRVKTAPKRLTSTSTEHLRAARNDIARAEAAIADAERRVTAVSGRMGAGAGASSSSAFVTDRLADLRSTARVAVGDLRRDVRRVTEAAAQLDNLATDARVIGADTKLRNVKVGLWLPYQAKDGAHLISASQEQRDNVKHARTGGDRKGTIQLWKHHHNIWLYWARERPVRS